jgi:protocatechuate 3,4-dioxygenase beta subunit
MRTLTALTILSLVALASWLFWPGDERPSGEVGGDRSAPAEAVARAAGVDGEAPPDRTPVAEPPGSDPVPAATAGSITVRLRFADDREPIAGAVLTRTERADFDARLAGERARTDNQGAARFASVPPGWHVVVASRFAWRAVHVPAGAEVAIDLDAARHGLVVGRVVDDLGAPVADAEVVGVPDHLLDAAATLARTDAAGRFRAALRAVNTVLFARKPGYGPSNDVEHVSFGREEFPVELVLLRGAHPVRGLVVDPAGRPVAGAEVFVKTRDPDPTPGQVPSGTLARWLRATSGVDGTFRLDDVPPGLFTGVARAPGFAASFFGNLPQPADRDGEVTITMEPGATLRGRVVDADGAPVAGAEVRAAAVEPWRQVAARTDERGEFRLDGIDESHRSGLGAVPVSAHHPRAGDAATRLPLADGETAVWNPTLRAAGAIRGRVVGADGAPLPGLPVRARTARDGELPTTTTDEDGRFELLARADAPHEVVVDAVTGFPPARLATVADARPGGEPLQITIDDAAWPSAFLSGRFVRPPGYEDDAIRLQYREEATRWSAVSGAAPDGSFRLGPLVPGTWRGTVIGFRSRLGGLDLGPFELAAGQELDVGALPIPAPVVLELAPRVPPDHDIGMLTAELLHEADRRRAARVSHVNGETLVRGLLEPGRYLLAIEAGFGWAGTEVPCALRPGPPNLVAFDLVPLRRVRVTVRGPDGTSPPDRLEVRIEPAIGSEIRIWGGRAQVSLAPGRHVLSAEHDGRRGRTEVEVDAVTGPVIEVELQLR